MSLFSRISPIVYPPETPCAITALYRIEGFEGVSSIGRPLCRETLASRAANVHFPSLQARLEKIQSTVRETGDSRHNGGPIEDTPLNPSIR